VHRHGHVALIHTATLAGCPFHRRREVRAVEIEIREVEDIKCTDMGTAP
jgi:hypothetical protein